MANYTILLFPIFTLNTMNIKAEKYDSDVLQNLIINTQLMLSPSGVAVVDSDEGIILWNKKFQEIWKLTDSDMKNLTREHFSEKIVNHLKNPDTFADYLKKEYDSSQKGTHHFEHVNGSNIEGKTVNLIRNGRYYGRIWIFTDISQHEKRVESIENYTSELRRMVSTRTQELIEAEKMAASGLVTSEIAHDLRSPLQSIRNAAHMIKQDKERIDVGLEIIEKSVLRSLEMLDGMRLSTRRAEPDFSNVNLNELIRDTVEELPKPDNITIHLEMDDVEETWIDGNQIRRVFDNILLNAVEAMPEGGTISITKHFVDKNYIIQISDTGVGIPEEVLPNLLKRKFFTTKPHGLGLGLSYCKRTLENHGGDLMVDSVLGKGTIFTITIPFHD